MKPPPQAPHTHHSTFRPSVRPRGRAGTTGQTWAEGGRGRDRSRVWVDRGGGAEGRTDEGGGQRAAGPERKAGRGRGVGKSEGSWRPGAPQHAPGVRRGARAACSARGPATGCAELRQRAERPERPSGGARTRRSARGGSAAARAAGGGQVRNGRRAGGGRGGPRAARGRAGAGRGGKAGREGLREAGQSGAGRRGLGAAAPLPQLEARRRAGLRPPSAQACARLPSSRAARPEAAPSLCPESDGPLPARLHPGSRSPQRREAEAGVRRGPCRPAGLGAPGSSPPSPSRPAGPVTLTGLCTLWPLGPASGLGRVLGPPFSRSLPSPAPLS